MSVRLIPTGRAQFLAAIPHIRQATPQAAAHFRQRVEEALRHLEQFPESGRVVPACPELPYREVMVSPDRCLYRLQETTAWVVAVWHGAQLPTEPQA